MKVELHVHTRYSKDSILAMSMLYAKCRLKKIDVIAITDHNTIAGGVAFQEFCKKRKSRIQVIVGSEIMTESGEIIGLFLHKEVPSKLSAVETVHEIKKQGGLVYIPHPYDEKRKKTVITSEALEEIREDVDCIECYNGRNISENYEEEQCRIANAIGKVAVVGSDAHTIFEIGRNYMECEETAVIIESKEDFLTRMSLSHAVKKPCIKFAHKITKFAKAYKLLQKGGFHELYRVINKRFGGAML